MESRSIAGVADICIKETLGECVFKGFSAGYFRKHVIDSRNVVLFNIVQVQWNGVDIEYQIRTNLYRTVIVP